MGSGAEVLIIGGGIIGSATAYSLAKAGASVVLLEKGEIGGEASGAAAGMLIPPGAAYAEGPFRDLCYASLGLYPSVIAGLEEETGTDVQFLSADLLAVAETEQAAQGLQALARHPGNYFEWADGESVRRLEPGLSPAILGAAYAADQRHVNPVLLTQAFAQAARLRGADLRLDTAVSGFSTKADRVLGVRTGRRTVAADHVVLAAGPWTRSLAGKLGAEVPTLPMRGQILAYRAAQARHIVSAADGYLVPKAGGFLYVGATEEDVGFRPQTTQRGLAWLRRLGRRLVPTLRYREIATSWAGLRPGSPDGLPIIGPLPGWSNVTVATGHFRNGILLAAATASLVAELTTTGKTEMPLEPFLPGRFSKQCP